MEKNYNLTQAAQPGLVKILTHKTAQELHEDVQRHLKEGWTQRNNMQARRILLSKQKAKEEQADHFACHQYEQVLTKPVNIKELT